MNYTEKISVVIPTYNRGSLIARSINSVLNQTYSNIEVIVIDDASTDNTEEVVKSIKDNRIKYIKYKKNRGACYARNLGIKEATGEYIAFQDSDDVFYPDKLEKQYKNMLANNSDIDFCKINVFGANGGFQLPTDYQMKNVLEKKYVDELCKGNFISTQAVIAKKKLFKNDLFDESLPRFQDYDLMLRLAPKRKISYTDEVLVDLYTQKDSISFSTVKLEKSVKIMVNKVYNLSTRQMNELRESLITMLLNVKSNECQKKYEELQKTYDELLEYNKIIFEDYNRIINSKRWKLVSKL